MRRNQSADNRVQIARYLPDVGLEVMTFEVGRLFEIGRQTADYRASAIRFQRTSPDGLPIPQLAIRHPQSADRRLMPGRCPQINCRCFYD